MLHINIKQMILADWVMKLGNVTATTYLDFTVLTIYHIISCKIIIYVRDCYVSDIAKYC